MCEVTAASKSSGSKSTSLPSAPVEFLVREKTVPSAALQVILSAEKGARIRFGTVQALLHEHLADPVRKSSPIGARIIVGNAWKTP